MPSDVWEDRAEWWRDTFAEGDDPEYAQQIIPLTLQHIEGSAAVLDVGTGEGQLARAAQRAGATTVVAVDRSGAMLRQAQTRSPGVGIVAGDITAIPLAPQSFDAVVVSLVLEHVDDLEPALAEVSRVLQGGGRLLLFLNHPFMQTPGSGWIEDHILEENYWRIGPYLTPAVTEEEIEPGVVIPFRHRPLSTYINLLARFGLLVTHMEEPAPPAEFITSAGEQAEGATVPRLLFLRCEKSA